MPLSGFVASVQTRSVSFGADRRPIGGGERRVVQYIRHDEAGVCGRSEGWGKASRMAEPLTTAPLRKNPAHGRDRSARFAQKCGLQEGTHFASCEPRIMEACSRRTDCQRRRPEL